MKFEFLFRTPLNKFDMKLSVMELPQCTLL